MLNRENNKCGKEYLLISPGYTMIRSKDHIEVMLEERLFRDTLSAGSKSPPATRQTEEGSSRGREQTVKKKDSWLMNRQTEEGSSRGREQTVKKKDSWLMNRQDIVEDLQEQIAKLTSLLDQETKEHRNTEIRLNKEIEEMAAQLQKKNEEDIRILQQKYSNDLQALQEQSNSRLAQEKADAEQRLEDLQKDYDFLKGSFSTYKESLCEEINESWAQKEVTWKEKFEEEKVRGLSKQKQKLRDLFENEKKEVWRQAQEELQMVQESHQKQVNEVWGKYKEAKQEFQKLNIVKENLQAEIAENKRIISSQHLEAQKVRRESEMLKSQLDHLRKQSHLRASKVEAQFKQRIITLTNENSDLRRRLITKSEQLFNERNRDDVGTMYLNTAGN